MSMILENSAVEYVDHMGDDLAVVNAARVSFDKESDWEHVGNNNGVPEPILKEGDEKLIRFLARNGHWTPFSHVMIKVRETVPIFVARQRFKHMIGFTYNEVSRRYVDDDPQFFLPTFRKRPDKSIKQGSGDEFDPWEQVDLIDLYMGAMYGCEFVYEQLLERGVAPEQARMVLPQSMFTSYIVTGSLAAWARAYKQRADNHAQKEIQDLTPQWALICSHVAPVSWAALTE